MKKLIIGLVSFVVGVSAIGQGYNQGALFSQPVPQVFSTNILTPSNNLAFLIFTNKVKIVNVQMLSGANNNMAWFFNSGSLANGGTNYATSLNVTTASTNINYVTSFVGYNGYTNWYTNAGVWTYSVTNTAATNALTPSGVFASAANTIGNYPCDMYNEQGLVIESQTNCQFIIYYIR